MLHTKNLTLAYNDKIVVENLNLEIPKGKITALVGPNGSGKSTVLKALARALKPKRGQIYLNNEDIYQKSNREVAKQIALLPQDPYAPENLTVRELVSYGRFPYQNYFGILNKKDNKVISWALEQLGISKFADKPLNNLSGGQRQSAYLAMVLAQDTPVLLLDEPTTFLDIAHQLTLLNFLKRFNSEKTSTIVMVLHDLNQASRYAKNIVAFWRGKILIQGTPKEVITPQVLQRVFAVSAKIIKDPYMGVPICIPFDTFIT